MKKYRLQEGVVWTCSGCGKKIEEEKVLQLIAGKSDIIFYDHRFYHKKCAPTLLEKLKKKLFGGEK